MSMRRSSSGTSSQGSSKLPKTYSKKINRPELLKNEYLRMYVQGKNLPGNAAHGSARSKERSANGENGEDQEAVLKKQSSKEFKTAHTSAQARMQAILTNESVSQGLPPLSQRTWFTSIIGAAVVANAIQLGVEVDYPSYKRAFTICEHVFTSIFSLEMIIKFVEMKCGYFRDCWNLIDFVLVWLAIVDTWILSFVIDSGDGPDLRIFSMLRILRILRLLRAVRLFKVFNELWKIVKGILDSLRAVSWTALLLIFLLYICGVFCCVMVGKNTTAGYMTYEDEIEHIDELGRDFDVYQYYGTVPRAMYTLFETCIEPLNIRPVIERQPWMAAFFLAFVFISTFGVLNVIIGVIVQHTMAVSDENKDAEKVKAFWEKMDQLELVRDYCFVDADQDGELSIEELVAAFQNPLVATTLEEVQMPLGMQPQELFDLLDSNGNGQVTHDEMLLQLTRATVHSEHQQLLDLKIGLHQTQRQIHELTSCLVELKGQVKYGFCQILPEEKMQGWPTGPCKASSSHTHESEKPQPCVDWGNCNSSASLGEQGLSGDVISIGERALAAAQGSFENKAKVRNGAEEKCIDTSNINRGAVINSKSQTLEESSHGLPPIPGQLPECLSFKDHNNNKASVTVTSNVPARIDSDLGRQIGSSRGGHQVVQANEKSHERGGISSRMADDDNAPDPPPWRPYPPPYPSRPSTRDSNTSSTELRPRPPDPEHLLFFSAPIESPNGMLCSTAETPPYPPATEPMRPHSVSSHRTDETIL